MPEPASAPLPGMPTIAIVGGGATGVLCAIALLRHPAPEGRRIVLFDPSAALGAGVAFGTSSPSHLLNVRARAMAALPDAPDDFVTWANRTGAPVTGDDFLPRAWYRSYLQDTLADSRTSASPRVTFEHQRRRVTDVRPAPDRAGWHLGLDHGSWVRADELILATGNRLPPSSLAEHERIVADPWAPGRVERLALASRVLIVGSGLTAVDVVLTLRDAGHRGTAHLVSRRGRLPAAHTAGGLEARMPAVQPGDAAATSVRRMLRLLRDDAALAIDWRQSVDGLRPVTTAIWRGLPLGERRRALRHLAAAWDVRRHRMAPEVARAIDTLRAEGRLSLGRGRVTGIAGDGDSLRATIVDGGVERTVVVDGAVVCTGPSADPAADPLLARMLGPGLIARHPLGLGLDVDAVGHVRRADGTAWPTLWAVGSLRKGAEWESTAVPELRSQAHEVAAQVLRAAASPGEDPTLTTGLPT